MKQKSIRCVESGFSYIDVMIAVAILMIGILGATAVLTTSIVRARETEQIALAKELANSTLESVFVCRDMRRPKSLEAWAQIGMVGTNPINGVPQGLFLSGWTPVRRDTGLDGVFGTVDDACPAPGNCQNYDGTYNTSEVFPEMERRVVITDLQTPNRPQSVWGILRRRVEITIRYRTAAGFREEKVATVITRFE